MASTTPEQGNNSSNHHDSPTLSAGLRQLVETFEQREQALLAREAALLKREKEIAELATFKKIAYGLMIEKSLREVPPLPEDVDLAAMVKEPGWRQLKDFIDEL